MADSKCTVSVYPQSAVGGSGFTFTGSGFHPIRLTAVESEVARTPTDMISNLPSDEPAIEPPALFYLMVVGFGVTGGAFLSRRLGAARSGLRP